MKVAKQSKRPENQHVLCLQAQKTPLSAIPRTAGFQILCLYIVTLSLFSYTKNQEIENHLNI